MKTTVRDRPGILVTGHDLKDLQDLLDQTKGTGVDVYTHGEMLPAHAYPAFRKYDNLVGNYGSSWWHQKEEFEAFNGPILITTNCIVPPKDSYLGRIYTTSVAGYPGTTHIPSPAKGQKDFAALIRHAKTCPPPQPLPGSGRDLITGCAHNAVLSLAGPVIDAIKKGDIKRFVVMAGCDGRQREREYYTEFAQALPANTIILTAGCAKYRYNNLDLGTIGGIPRVLDAGQCNDSDSLVVIATCTRRSIRGGNQRPPRLLQHRVVRTEGRAGPPGPAQPRNQGHHPRAQASGIRLPGSPRCPREKLRYTEKQHGGGGPPENGPRMLNR